MVKRFMPVAIVVILAAGMSAAGSAVAQQQTSPTPVLVELFTSEGCSSCPPADALLQQLDRWQPVAGVQLIVLSEHVDYWNHDGWTDPYSSHFFTERQNGYSDHFRLATVYTPQMVVDGNREFTGNDGRLALQACQKAAGFRKLPVRLSLVSAEKVSLEKMSPEKPAQENPGNLRVHIEADALDESYKLKQADIYVVVALNSADSQVAAGENKGRHLNHVAVVQSLTKVGSVKNGKSFAQDVRLKLEPRTDPGRLRIIAFVQESGQGQVLGAALQRVTK
jgi:hypothetical protein